MSETGLTVEDVEVAAVRPAPERDPMVWARKNLFSTWYNSLLTVLLGVGVLAASWSLVRFFVDSDFEILRENLALLMVGSFPRDQLWRPSLAMVIVAIIIGLMAGMAASSARARADEAGIPLQSSTVSSVARRFWPVLGFIAATLLLTETLGPWLVAVATLIAGAAAYPIGLRLPISVRRLGWLLIGALVVVVYFVLAGGGVSWDDWGGLQLNLFLTIAGILFAFPLGLLLALGRRSSLPALRAASVTYIEFVRGVPLITLLLMGMFVIGFFLPEGFRPGNVTRVLIAITLFEAAYIAEVVRGGLQSVPRGQVEAAQAVGLSPWKTMRLVVLPQALRNTIPAMVGQFISLFKDTTLVIIVNMIDILGASQAANAQGDFFGQGLHLVTLPYVALAFWVGSYVMSREARRLERKLGVGVR